MGRSIDQVVSKFGIVKKIKPLSHLGMIAVPSVLVGDGCAPVFISKTESADKQERRIMLKENQMVHTDGGTDLYVVALMELSLFDFDREFASHRQRLFSLSREHQADVIEAVLAVLREKGGTGIRWPRSRRWSSTRNTCG